MFWMRNKENSFTIIMRTLIWRPADSIVYPIQNALPTNSHPDCVTENYFSHYTTKIYLWVLNEHSQNRCQKRCGKYSQFYAYMPLVKAANQKPNFLISQLKHMLWVFKRFEHPKQVLKMGKKIL